MDAGGLDTRARWTDVVLSFITVRFVLWTLVIGFVVPGWIESSYHLLEYMDDHQFQALELAGQVSIAKYHQIPAWNPWWCGGHIGIAEPETAYLAPDFLLRVIYGVPFGRHLANILALYLGLEGMYRLAREQKSSAVGAAFAAVLFATYNFFFVFVHDGAINFLMGFCLMPWAALSFFRGLESFGWRLVGGFAVAWIFQCAGTYPAPFTVLMLALLFVVTTSAAMATGVSRAWRRPFVSLGTMGVVAFLLTASKLLPLLVFIRQFQRVWNPVEAQTAQFLFGDFVTHYPWLLLFALAGLLFLDRRAAMWVAGAGFFFLMAMGDFGGMSPYHLLKRVPVLGQLRNPERYMVVFMLFVAVAASRGVTLVQDALPVLHRRLMTNIGGARTMRRADMILVQWVLVAISTVVLVQFLFPRVKTTLTENQITAASLYTFEPARPYDGPFRQSRGNRRDGHAFVAANMGNIYCILGIPIAESPNLRGDLPAEEYALDPAKATVKRVRWTPNEIELEVVAQSPATVIVNQNYSKKFRASVGKVIDFTGLLAVEVPAGTHRLRIVYRDYVLYFGLFLSGSTLLALAAYAAFWLYRAAKHRITWFRTLPLLPGSDP